MIRALQLLRGSGEEHSGHFVQPGRGDGCSSHGPHGATVCSPTAPLLYIAQAGGLVLLSQSVYQAARYHRHCKFLLSRRAVTWILKKKKDYSDALWLKLNQVRTGQLIKKKENQTHRGPTSAALAVSRVWFQGTRGSSSNCIVQEKASFGVFIASHRNPVVGTLAPMRLLVLHRKIHPITVCLRVPPLPRSGSSIINHFFCLIICAWIR